MNEWVHTYIRRPVVPYEVQAMKVTLPDDHDRVVDFLGGRHRVTVEKGKGPSKSGRGVVDTIVIHTGAARIVGPHPGMVLTHVDGEIEVVSFEEFNADFERKEKK